MICAYHYALDWLERFVDERRHQVKEGGSKGYRRWNESALKDALAERDSLRGVCVCPGRKDRGCMKGVRP